MVKTTPEFSTVAPRHVARDRFRNRVIESATDQRMRKVSGAQSKMLQVLLEYRKNCRTSESYHKRANTYRRNVEREWTNGDYNVLDHIDFERLIRAGIGEDKFQSLKRGSRSSRIVEDVGHAITSDFLSDLLVTNIRYGVIERCQIAPTIHLSLVDTELRLVPGTANKLVKFNTEADVVEDDVAEEELTRSFAPARPNLVTLPDPRKKKFKMGFTREAMTIAPNNILRQEIDKHANAMDLHIEKLLIDLLWGLFDHNTAGANRFPYIENDNEINPFQLVGGAGPWENDLTGNPLNSTSTPFSTIETIIERRTDPYSGEAIDCGEDDKILVVSREQMRQARDGLGIIQIGQDLGGANNKRQAIERAAGQFDVEQADIIRTRHVYNRLKAWYATTGVPGGASADPAAAASITWLYGDFRRAAGFATEWEREKLTREGPNTDAYFEQEIVYEAKWMEKSTPYWKDPMLVFRNRE